VGGETNLLGEEATAFFEGHRLSIPRRKGRAKRGLALGERFRAQYTALFTKNLLGIHES
jgi:hypothetical protein